VLSVQTVLLFHDAPGGAHHDWLLEDPLGPGDRRLLAWRAAEPWWRWPLRQPVMLTAIAPHRRRYLQHEGELGGGRGAVRRLDQGLARVRQWDQGGLLELQAARFAGVVRLRRQEPTVWELIVEQTASAAQPSF